MYPFDYYRGVHKKSTHDYTGVSGVDDYWNSSDSNPVTDCVSWGTGITGHLMSIEYELGLTPGGTHGSVKGWLDDLSRRTSAESINWYLAGQIPDGSQFISGISFGPYRVQLTGIEANLRTAPVGAIGGHFDVHNTTAGGGAKLLSLHLNAGDIWGSVVGSSYLEASEVLYIYTPTGSTMEDVNLTLHFK